MAMLLVSMIWAATALARTGYALPGTGDAQDRTGSTLPGTGDAQDRTGSTLARTGSALPDTGSALADSGSALADRGSAWPNTDSNSMRSVLLALDSTADHLDDTNTVPVPHRFR